MPESGGYRGVVSVFGVSVPQASILEHPKLKSITFNEPATVPSPDRTKQHEVVRS